MSCCCRPSSFVGCSVKAVCDTCDPAVSSLQRPVSFIKQTRANQDCGKRNRSGDCYLHCQELDSWVMVPVTNPWPQSPPWIHAEGCHSRIGANTTGIKNNLKSQTKVTQQQQQQIASLCWYGLPLIHVSDEYIIVPTQGRKKKTISGIPRFKNHWKLL